MIAPVQALRFLAAFWVVLYHARPPVLPAGAEPEVGSWLPAIASMGFAGVDVFFVISGAIMAQATQRLSGTSASRAFIARRFARIYAGWWPFFLLYLLGRSLVAGLEGKELWGSFFLWPMAPQAYLLPIVWTLSFELYFYLVLGLLLPLSRPHLRLALLAWAVVVAAYTAWQVAAGHFEPGAQERLGIVDVFLLSPLVLEFVAGFLLREALRGRRVGPWWGWALAGMALAAAAYVVHTHGAMQAEGLAGWFHAPERAVLLGGMGVCFVAAALLAPVPQGQVFAAMAHLGDASYSLYLCHILVLGAFYAALSALGLATTAPLPAFLLALTLVTLYAWLHFRWVERPLTALARKMTLPAMETKLPK